MRKKNILTILILMIFCQISYTQNYNVSNDSILKLEALRIADSLFKIYNKDSGKIETNLICNYWIYDGHGNIIGGSGMNVKHGEYIKLIDSLTYNYFILDSSHIFITAYNKFGKEIWKTDPYNDNSIPKYRTKRPVIVNYRFDKCPKYFQDKLKLGEKVIWITYNNTQFGFIDIDTGNYIWCGQD